MASPVKPAGNKSATPKKSTKKAAIKKKVAVKSETGIKYEDKSGDQPELIPIFNGIKKLLMPYKKGSIKMRGGSGGQVTLVSEKPVIVAGKKRDELWFAGALIQRGYAGFYFMPVKSEAEKREVFGPELLKCLKGKSCFHIKKADAEIFKQIKEALAKGCLIYKEKGLL